MPIIHILIIAVFQSGPTALTTVEYTSLERCEQAGQAFVFATKDKYFKPPIYICTRK